MSEPLLPPAGKPFAVDSDEGRAVLLEVVPRLLDSEDAFRFGVAGELRFRLTNAEAADLLARLEAEVGDWMRERDSVLRAFSAGEESLSADARAEYGLEAVEGDGEAYDPLDPKHSAYAENLRELADAGRKAERESS